MLDLVRKRHEGDGWRVFYELGNSGGSQNRGYADAVAFGLWPSLKYELHGYELKESRGDVRKELKDITKSHVVGKYCHYWWLVVRDLAIIDGLVIPPTWGILVPKSQVLRVHVKAPRRKAAPIDPGFTAAMIRNVTCTWISKPTHQAVLEKLYKLEHPQSLEYCKRCGTNPCSCDDAQRELHNLKRKVEWFQKESGVDLITATQWNAGAIGQAVKMLLDARAVGRPVTMQQVRTLEDIAYRFAEVASLAKSHAEALRTLTQETDVQTNPQEPAPFTWT